MAGDLNKVMLIGRLVRDPELRYTPNGASVASFSIANNRTYVASGEKKEMVSFFNCVAWGKTAEFITQYCKKGNRVGIEGRLQQRSWEDQQGNKRNTVEITVENIQNLTPRDTGFDQQTESPAAEPDIQGSPGIDNPFSDDDIPF
ncbi:MAG TPA: single-stranded DNA-binding protein [Spirochaetota bacterium]|nr:single-stranded DNA-binding protein [Spirochaetota bacterium]HPI90416.1 single-stranded DNA-binding protein [Spirochaetota bacterium]HPR46542.1 single-stranded DNA-binding protein [Spirochaetota bacterium]